MIGEVLYSLSEVSSSKKIETTDPRLQKIYSRLDEWEREKDHHEARYRELMNEIDILRGNDYYYLFYHFF